MAGFEERLRKLEERFVHVPSIDEYLDASNREQTRALHVLVKRLEKYGFDCDHVFPDYRLRMLGDDAPERREKDRETVEAWYRAQGRDRAAGVEGAKERLLARLGAP